MVGYCSTQEEVSFKAVDYSNPDAIYGLLKFYNVFKAMGVKKMNTEILTIYIDIAKAIKGISSTENQLRLTALTMQGYQEKQIGDKLGITRQAVSKVMKKVCLKISKYLTEVSEWN